MKSGTTELMKFKRLQKRLSLNRMTTVGLLESLWMATTRNCIHGDIGQFTNEEIAILVDWEGDHDELIAALVECKWLDECSEKRLVVHDWLEHCPNFVKGGIATKAKQGAKPIAKQGAIADSSEPPAIHSIQFNSIPSIPNQAAARLGLEWGLEGGKDLNESGLKQTAQKIANEFRQVSNKTFVANVQRVELCQFSWVFAALDKSAAADCIKRLNTASGIKQPVAYVEGAVRKLCTRKGYNWDQIREFVPVANSPPPPLLKSEPVS